MVSTKSSFVMIFLDSDSILEKVGGESSTLESLNLRLFFCITNSSNVNHLQTTIQQTLKILINASKWKLFFKDKDKNKNNNVGKHKGKDNDEGNDRDNDNNSFPKEISGKLITFSHNKAMRGVADSLFIHMACLVEVVIELDICFLFFCISQRARRPAWLR